MHSYHSLWLRFSLFFTLLCQLIRSLRIRNERTKPGYVRSRSYQLNVWPRLCRGKSTLVFTNSFGTLHHFKVDCNAGELTQGQHLVIMMMDTGLEKDSQASSVLRIYYESPTSSTSEVELLLLMSTHSGDTQRITLY